MLGVRSTKKTELMLKNDTELRMLDPVVEIIRASWKLVLSNASLWTKRINFSILMTRIKSARAQRV